MRRLTHGALIAALYCALTLLLQPFSFGAVQFRLSEALTMLPLLTDAAVPGLFIGCLLSNLLGASTIFDIVFGSLATLLAAVLTRKLRSKPLLAAACPVLCNGLITGTVVSGITHTPILLSMLWIAVSEAVICYLLGLPLIRLLKRTNLFTSEGR